MANQAQPQTLAIIGLSKNAGKTTVLNAIIQQEASRKKLAVFSIGVDGEKQDLWSRRSKPQITIPEGMLVVTAKSCLDEQPGNWCVLQKTGLESLLGPLYITRATCTSTVKLAGIRSTDQIAQVMQMLAWMDVELVLIDGAYDRKASASSGISDRVIAVIGASADRSFQQVMAKAEEFVRLFSLPKASQIDLELGRIALALREVVARVGGEMMPLGIANLFGMNRLELPVPANQMEAIGVPGALTDRALTTLIQRGVRAQIVVTDATHLFLSLAQVKQYVRLGGGIEVMQPIQLCGLAVNPSCPDGYTFSPEEMKQRVQEIAASIPVFDVMRDVDAEVSEIVF